MTTTNATLTTLAVFLAGGLALDRAVFGSRERRSPLDGLLAVLLFGHVGVGGLALVAGHADLLSQGTFVVLAIVGGVYLALDHARLWRIGRAAAAAVGRAVRGAPLLSIAAAVTFALTSVSASRGALNPDEKDYKWAAPLFFANLHRFFDTPFRLSNGLFLDQLVVLPAATFASLHSARQTQLLAVALLTVSTAAVARRLGGSGVVAGFAALSCFIVPIHARDVGSDLPAAAFLAAAFALLLSPADPARNRIGAGIALAAAAATKAYTLALLPVFVVVALLVEPDGRGTIRWKRPSRRLLTGLLAPIPIVIAVAVLHTLTVTGVPYKETLPNNGIWPSGSPELATGQAAGRIPSAADVLMIPLVPFVVGIAGNSLYGTRVGVLFALAVPTVIIGTALAPPDWRRRVLVPGLVGAASYLLLAPVFVKTRFLLFSWLCVFAALDVLVASWRATWSRRAFGFGWVVVRVAVLVSFLDVIRLLWERLPPG